MTVTTRPRCMVAGCARVAFRKGMCETHYLKFKKAVPERTVRLCDVPGCGGKHYGSGMCRTHWGAKYKAPRKSANKPPPKAAIHMVCPSCGENALEVRDSRPTTSNTIRRRRLCTACGSRFTTFEIFADAIPSMNKVNYKPAITALEGVLGILSALADPKTEASADADA